MDFTNKNVEEIEEYLRFWFGDLTESQISSENMQKIIQLVIDRNPEYTGCQVVYYSAVEVLQWLIRQQSKGQAGSLGAGLSKKTEKVGDVSISQEYAFNDSSVTSGWDRVLEDLEEDPSSIGCIVFTDSKEDMGLVLLGGVSQKEYHRVKDNPDSRNGYDVETEYRKSPYSCFSNRRKNKRYYDI